MTSVIDGLKPQKLWEHFEALTRIPRGSKNEAQVLEFLRTFASQRELEFREDEAGNIVILRPGSGGGEKAPAVVLQGHVDMVCEKNRDSDHDFAKDPLTLRLDEDYMLADGTTLGADNGIGLAAAMAALESPHNLPLPPLECLFTVDEETGLTGAFQLDPELLEGRLLINLDTEEWGSLYVGCAGGGDSTLRLPVKQDPIEEAFQPWELVVEGLLGGHSGVDIHEERANAVKLLARMLYKLSRERLRFQLADLSGGDKHNAIPREARATILFSQRKLGLIQEFLNTWEADLMAEFGTKEPNLKVTLKPLEAKFDSALRVTHRDRLLGLIQSLPHGVIKMSHDIPGLVETSNNVASVKKDGDEFLISCSTRSSVAPALESQRERIAIMAWANHATTDQGESYPGWQPDLASPALKLIKRVYKNIHGNDPEVAAIHAGLECGIISEKFPGMDAISLGPTIQYPHSPGERVQISTVSKFYDLLMAVLAELAKKKPVTEDFE